MDKNYCYCGIALECPMHKRIWHDAGSWWVASDIEDDPHGPFESLEDAEDVIREMR